MKVECIRADWPNAYKHHGCTTPTLGQILTVRWADEDSLRFEEIMNPDDIPCHHHGTGTSSITEPSFDRRYFRPITDISALQKLTKVRELEDA